MNVIYDEADNDGWMAAAILCHAKPVTNLVGWRYGKPMPTLVPGEVFIVDLRPTKELVDHAKQYGNIVVIDHHDGETYDGVVYFVNKEYSAAGLAWMYCHPRTEPIPEIVQYVQDYDLWQFKLTDTRLYNSGLNYIRADSLNPRNFIPYVFDVGVSTGMQLAALRAIGTIVERVIQARVKKIAAGQECITMLGDLVFKCVNTNDYQNEVSDILGGLVACWYQRGNGKIKVSLRNRGTPNVNLAEIAALFPDGGGRETTAGFICDRVVVEGRITTFLNA